MARRSAVRNGPVYPPSGRGDTGAPGYSAGGYEPADPYESANPWNAAPPADDPPQSGRKRRGSGGGWGGAGGRWFVWLGRLVLWAFILVVVVNGIRVPFERFTTKSATPAPTPAATTGTGFPVGTASAYALSFASVYLNYDPTTVTDRQRQLGVFLADGLDPQLGWNSSGKMVLQSAQVASVQPSDANHAIVTLLVRANGNSFQLAVPVYAKDGAMVISAAPALLAMPAKATLPAAPAVNRDTALETELTNRLQGFFIAYATSDAAGLAGYGYTGHGGLNGAATLVQVKSVVAPQGDPNSRTVTVVVDWQLPSATAVQAATSRLEQTYQLSVVKKDGSWDVADVQG
jgi:Conjugative transposon protein TcpC